MALTCIPCIAVAQFTDSFDPQPDGEVYALAVQRNGQVLTGGDFTTLGGVSRTSLGRLLPGGGLDSAFDAAIRPDPVNGDDVLCLATQPDGRLLIGGQFGALGGESQPFLARLQPNGARDGVFDLRPYDSTVWALAVQADGKFLVAGGDPSAPLRRCEAHGWPDLTFNPTANGEIRCVAVQADGRILVGGRFTTLNGQPRNYLGRLRADGTLDDTFNPNADAEVRTLVVQPDGRILVGGDFTGIGGQSHARLARIGPDGAVEASFNAGPGADQRVETLALQADGKIIVGGRFSRFGEQSREGIARLLSDGSLDAGFDPSGTFATVHALALQPDGKLLVGGLIFQLMAWVTGNLGRVEGLGEATQSLAVDGASVTWQRGGASPEVWRVAFESSTDGVNWTPLGAGTRIPGGWQLTGLSLPAIANVRARGWVTGGQGNGSAWYVESVVGAPLITGQPTDQARCTGEDQTATFSVIVGGEGPFTYQWRKDGAVLPDNASFEGTTTATLQVLGVGAATAGAYDVIVTGSDGSVVSAVARLSLGEPTIVTSPVSMTRNPGGSVTFQVVATGAPPLTYQWRQDGVPLAGENYASLTLEDLQRGDQGAFDVVIANTCGSVTSAPALLTVLPTDWSGPTLLGQWPGYPRGPAQAVAVSGSFAYVAAGVGGLIIFDITNPANPIRVGSYDRSFAGAVSVQVVGSLIYVANGTGLQVIDVSHPAIPVRLGGYDTGGDAQAVHVVGSLAYVADYGAGLQVIDVSDPANPVRVGGYRTRWAKDVQVVGTLAYVVDAADGLVVIDVSHPANPVRLGGYESGGAVDVQVVGSLAYVVGSAGVQVVDVSHPANPVRLGGSGSSGDAHRVQVVGSLAYVANEMGLEVIDVSHPANPVRVGGFHHAGGVEDVQVVGSLTYVAAHTGLQVIDLSIPALPVRVGGDGARASASGVQVVGSLAYVADGNAGVQVIDVSHPANPVRVGSYDTREDALRVQVVGSLAYVADSAGLLVIDVSNPVNPVGVGSYETSGSAVRRVQVVGNTAYAVDSAGLQIVDVSDPANPVRVGGYDNGGHALGVHVVGSLAYVVGSAGLQIVDVSHPANPVRLGGYDNGASGLGVHVVGSLAYLADWGAGLQVIDVGDPANPVRVGGYDSGGAFDVQVVGSLAYVASGSSGLLVIDVSHPANPVRVGGYDTRGTAYHVHVVGNLAYVADGDWGLAVLQLFGDRPVIQAHPVSQTRASGESVTFTVTTVGTLPKSYQWRKDGVPLPGQTGATFTLSGIKKADAGIYDVIVANDYGSTASDKAELSLHPVLDESFHPQLYQSVLALTPQSDGGVLLVGYPGMLGIGDRRTLARLDREGIAEPAFGPNVGRALGGMASRGDGSLWVGSERLPGESANRLVRLDGQGSVSAALDLTRAENGQGEVRSLAFQADGKLLVGGVFGALGGKPRLGLARLNADGTVDDGFRTDVHGLVGALAVQPDGRILVGGPFWRLADQSGGFLGRLLPDGRIDGSFANTTDGGYVQCLVVRPDGRILVGGTFTSWNGVPRTNLCRVTAAGQLDPDFNPVVTGHLPGQWEGVTSLALQADGKILLAGLFTTVGGLPRTYLARLHPDGTPDALFAPNPNSSVGALALDADGGVLAGGTFSSIAGVWQPSAARLLNPDPAINDLQFTPSTITWRRGGSAPEVWRTTFEASADGVNWTPLGAGSRITGGWQLTGLSLEGQSRIRARGFVGSGGGSDYFVESYAGAPTIPDGPRLTFPEPGEPLTLTARVAGTGPFSFQWFKAGQALTDGGNLEGTTRADLTIHNPTADDAGEYSVEVGNALGQMLAPVATVAFGPPQILRPPASLTVRMGESAGFSVVVEGTPPLTYRWRKNAMPIVGATQPFLSLPTTVLPDAGDYDVVVENSYGTVVSAPAQLTVRFPDPGALAFSQAELEANENAGTVELSVARLGGGDGAVSVDYRWAAGGTATEGQDFTFTSGTLRWAAGETGAKAFAVTILDDSVVEAAETIRLELANPTGGASLGTPALATVTITDNDAPPTRALALTPSPAGAGTIQANPLPGTDGRYVQGTTVTLTATAASGAVFLRWEGALTGRDLVGTLTVTEDQAVQAVFSRPFGGVARPVPGLIQAEDFDEGGEGIGYHDVEPVNQGGSTYRTGGVDVLLGAQGLRIGWSDNGEWLNYTVNVPAAGRYRAVLRVSSGESGGTGRLRLPDGQTTGLIAAPGTGAWSSYVEVTSAPFTLDAGTQVVRFEYVQAGFDLDWIRLEEGTLRPLSAASLAASGEVGVGFPRALDPASATRAAHYEIPGATVTAAALAPDASGVLLRVTGTLEPIFTVRMSGVRDTLGNQVEDGTEVVGQVLAQSRQDVGKAGDPAVPGVTFSSRAGDFEVRAGGTDMWNNQDGFHFIHQPITGDFDVRVRVESLEPVHRFTKAGLMARESLAADSRNLTVVVEPPAVPTHDSEFGGVGADTYAVQGRMARGGPTVAWTRDGAVLTGPPYPNAWLRLQREGAVFRAYRGNDGAQWTLLGETTQGLPATLYVGLGTSSHNNTPGYTTLARYREYQHAGLVAPQIITEPAEVAAAVGESARFEVTATGSAPLLYQWQFDGTNLAGANGPVFTLENVTREDAGTYRMVVWNDAGLDVSRGARLNVRQALQLELNPRAEGGAMELVISGLVGERFRVLVSTDLVHWTVLSEAPDGSGTVRVPLSQPDAPTGFFRVQAGP